MGSSGLPKRPVENFGLSGFGHEKGVGQSRQGPRCGRHDEYIRTGLVESTPFIWITSWSKLLGSEVHTPIEAEGVPSEVPRREEKLSDVQSAWLDVSPLPFLATLPAVSASAANAMDAADNLSATTTYVPSAMDAGDGWAQFVVLMVTALWVGGDESEL